MKKTILLLVLAAFTTGAFASVSDINQQKRKRKAKSGLKAHVCTAACKDGKHVYAHGEKGHVCGPECKNAKM